MSNRTIAAILWDYDGTLVDSRHKNFATTKEILTHIDPHYKTNLPEVLQSFATYQQANEKAKNWQDLYLNFYKLPEEKIAYAGELWSVFQKNNSTPVNLFDGINTTIASLKSLSHGICSQNCAENIANKLTEDEICHHFKSIIGYDNVEHHQQKPNPAGFIHCLEQMQVKQEGVMFYIGDHEADVEFAKKAEALMQANGSDVTVISIAAGYGGAKPVNWSYQPDHLVNTPIEILSILENYN